MLTVLMATYNGSETLAACLEAYRLLEPPSGGWKLVIVDNGSTDSTLSLIQSFAKLLPIQILQEPVRGKNTALNRGLQEIEGDLAVFTDDDVVPHPRWLAAMREAADTHSEYSVLGGKILLRWPAPPPAWIEESVPLAAVYGATKTGLREGPMRADDVFGGNMAIRAGVFSGGIRFDPAMGPSGTRAYAMGSETELCLRLDRSGLRAWHVEQAVTEHMVRSSQLTSEWIWQRAQLSGRGSYRLYGRQRFANAWKFGGVPAALAAQAVLQAGKLALAWRSPSRRQQARWQWNRTLGRMLESRDLRHLPAEKPQSGGGMLQGLGNRPLLCGNFHRLSTLRSGAGFHILMYHRLLETPDPYYFYGVMLRVFEAQLATLSRSFAVLPLSEIMERIRSNQPLPRRCVALTFDDGYRDLFTLGIPLLEQYRLPATVYVSVQCLDRGFVWPDLLRYMLKMAGKSEIQVETLRDNQPARFALASESQRLQALREINRRLKLIGNRDKNMVLAELSDKLLGRALDSITIPGLMLSWDELRSLSRGGLEIGAHTITHPILTRLPLPECEAEVRGSARRIEEGIGKPVRHFAYPYGGPTDYSPEIRRMVQTAGFDSAANAILGRNTRSCDPFDLHRVDAARESAWELIQALRRAGA